MKQENRNKGRVGEGLAVQELRKKGYEILETNFANKFGEIDVIAKDGEVLVFVEVKAKTGIEFGEPEEMVGRGKLSKVRRMASLYMGDKEERCRIDVVAMVLTPEDEVVRLTHYVNVY
jgi:putative endonuclease